MGVILGLALLQSALSPVQDMRVQDAPVAGPLRLCLKYSSFDLAKDERVTAVAMGVEGMSMTISTLRGEVTIDESEILAAPKSPGRLIARRADADIYSRNGPRYAVYGSSASFSDLSSDEPKSRRDTMILLLSGPGMLRSGDASAVLARLHLGKGEKRADCGHRYYYGWDTMFPENQ